MCGMSVAMTRVPSAPVAAISIARKPVPGSGSGLGLGLGLGVGLGSGSGFNREACARAELEDGLLRRELVDQQLPQNMGSAPCHAAGVTLLAASNAGKNGGAAPRPPSGGARGPAGI